MSNQSSSAMQAPTIDALATSFSANYAGVMAFIAVASEGSFARAGDRLGIGRSAVSRSVQKLEDQLGVRLFQRTTRNTALTGEGERFFSSCNPGVERIAQALEDMRDLRQGPPRGLLRISAATGFGRKVVAPLLRGFHARYPDIAIELQLDDSVVDFTSGRVDVSFRNGHMEDSRIIAKRLIPMQMVVCASPQYAARHGLPLTLEALATHRGIHFRLASGRVFDWEFKVAGQRRRLLSPAVSTFNDTELVLQAVLDGQGIAQLAGYQVGALLRGGQLVSCLDAHAPDDRGHYLCYLSRQHLPSRIRVFVDYMTMQIRALDLHCLTGVPSITAGVVAAALPA